MKKLILVLFVGSLLALGSYADKKKEADPAKPAKSEKGKKKAKGKEVTVAGDVKCGHCDFKIGDKCAAVLKTEKVVTMSHRAQSVGDDEDSLFAMECSNGVHDLTFGFGVQGTRRFVQYE